MIRRSHGFTLIEILATLLTFSVFSLTLLGVLILAMQYLNRADADIIAQQSCKNAIDYIVFELRQGVSNPDPGRLNPPTGFMAIEPAVEPTAVLVPNANSRESEYLLFTEINNDTFPPSPVPDPFIIEKTNPAMYQQVKFYVYNHVLYREIRTISSAGILNPPVVQEILRPEQGTVALHFRWLGTRLFEVTVTVSEDLGKKTERTYSSTTNVSIMAR